MPKKMTQEEVDALRELLRASEASLADAVNALGHAMDAMDPVVMGMSRHNIVSVRNAIKDIHVVRSTLRDPK